MRHTYRYHLPYQYITLPQCPKLGLPVGTSTKRKLPSAAESVAYIPPLRITLVGGGASTCPSTMRPSMANAWVGVRMPKRCRRNHRERRRGRPHGSLLF